jgi:hypothetical protein
MRPDTTKSYNQAIRDVRIYNRALSETEISNLYNGIRVKDGLVAEYSGRNFLGTEAVPTSIIDTSNMNYLEAEFTENEQTNILVTLPKFVEGNDATPTGGVTIADSAIVMDGSTGYITATEYRDSLYTEFYVGDEDSTMQGFTFKPDGLKLYTCGSTSDKIYQYTLSTAWDITTTTYDSVSKAIGTEDVTPRKIKFKSDVTKAYLLGGATDKVYQYSLSNAWDISTMSYDSVSLNVTTQEPNPTGMTFKSDGTSVYVTGTTNDKINQYDMTTAWDLSTASYYGQFASPDGQSSGLFFSFSNFFKSAKL